jgi:hypothetical protein
MEEEKWVVRFLNLPSQEQVEFLYRYCLDETIKDILEKKVFDSEN